MKQAQMDLFTQIIKQVNDKPNIHPRKLSFGHYVSKGVSYNELMQIVKIVELLPYVDSISFNDEYTGNVYFSKKGCYTYIHYEIKFN